jgi:PadR family transcriptional regulator PadR
MARSKPRLDGVREPRSFLPLKPDVFLILTILAEGARHGYGIMQAAEEWSGGGMEIQAGALYRRLRWMAGEGLIEEVEVKAWSRDALERRRCYRVTPFGRAVALEEARRMRELLAAARATQLVSGTEGA